MPMRSALPHIPSLQTLQGGQGMRKRRATGDLPGCLHTRPLVDFPGGWATFASYVRREATSEEPIAFGERNALLVIRGVGPMMLASQLRLLRLAYIGNDSQDDLWIMIPVQSAHGLIPMTDDVPAQLEMVKNLLIERADLSWGDLVTFGFKPTCASDDGSDIVAGGGDALDMFRIVGSTGRSFVTSSTGALKPHIVNTNLILECDAVFQNVLRYDELDHKVWICYPLPWEAPGGTTSPEHPRRWVDNDNVEAASWMASTHGLTVSSGTVDEAVKTVARRCSVHRVRDFLKQVRWDGVDRIGAAAESAPGWLSTYFGAANTPYVRLVGRYWLMSAVARAFEPGCKVDSMLILEGDQGTGKSSGIALLGNVVVGVVKDTPLDWLNKDKYQQLDGAWIYELAELSGITSKVSAETLKGFITSPDDNYRRSYGHEAISNPRHNVFFGTVNPEEGQGYLIDSTGARRYWPVPIVRADFEAIKRDREQIWAEAVELYKNGAAARAEEGATPIAARWWTAPDDKHLWETEGRKRSGSGDALVDVLRPRLLGPGGYLEKDVQLCMAAGVGVERPYACLPRDRIMLEYLDMGKGSGLVSTRDGKRVTNAMRELGFSTCDNRLIRSVSTGAVSRHYFLVSEAQDRLRRVLLAEVLLAAGLLGKPVEASAELSCLRAVVVDVELIKGWSALSVELRTAIEAMRDYPDFEPLLWALSGVLGFDVMSVPASTDSGKPLDDTSEATDQD